MSTWDEFADDAGPLAQRGLALWNRHVLMYLATVRGDGSPRVHPVVPVLADGRLFVAIPQESPKAADLRREPRCVLHALPGKEDEEFVLRCTARAANSAHDLVKAAAEHIVHSTDDIFEFAIDEADFGSWDNVGQPNTTPRRHRWVDGEIIKLKPH